MTKLDNIFTTRGNAYDVFVKLSVFSIYLFSELASNKNLMYKSFVLIKKLMF